MLFDADQVHEALEKPRFKAGGRTYTGRVLSAWEISAHQALFDQMALGPKMDPEKVMDGVKKLVKTMFGWRAWRRFRKLHPMIQMQAVLSFMEAQAAVTKATSLGVKRAEKPSPVPRSDS